MKPSNKDTAMDENDTYWELPTEAEMKVIRAKRERNDKISSLMGEYLLKGYKMLSSICNTCDTILMQDKHENIYCVACAEIDCTESAKDDPTLSETAARRQVQESQFSANSSTSSSSNKDDTAIGDHYGLPTTGTTQSTPSISKHKTPGICLTSSASARACLSSLGGPAASCTSEEKTETPEDHTYNTSSQETKMNVDDNIYDVLQSPEASGVRLHHTICLTPQELILKEKIEWACRLLKNSKNTQRCIELSNLIKSCAESLAAINALNKYNSSVNQNDQAK